VIKDVAKNALALDVWVNHEDPTVGANAIMDFGNGDSDRIRVDFYSTHGKMHYGVNRGSSLQNIRTAAVFPTKAWTRVTITHNAAKTVTIYWNGVAQTLDLAQRGASLSGDKKSATVHLPKEVTRTTNLLGTKGYGGGFVGEIKDFRFWNKVVTTAQIEGVALGVAPAVQVAVTVTACATGKFAVAGTAAADCKVCGGGTFATANASVCTLCAAGRHQPTTGQGNCSTCNQTSKVIGLTACGTCGPGQRSTVGSDACTFCAADEYQPNAGRGSCITCHAAAAAIADRTGCRCGSANEKWDAVSNTCKPPCESLAVLNAVAASTADAVAGSNATVTCNTGYGPSTQQARCAADLKWTFKACAPVDCGTWTFKACAPVDCGTPPTAANSKQLTSPTTFGSARAYICLTGYEIKANKKDQKFGGTVTCLNTSKWERAPVCAPIDCGNATAAVTVANGRVVATAGTTFNSAATVICAAKYQGGGTIECKANGKWTSAPTCYVKSGAATCGQLKVLHGTTPTKQATYLGAKVAIKCNDGYKTTTLQAVCVQSPAPSSAPSGRRLADDTTPMNAWAAFRRLLTCSAGKYALKGACMECAPGRVQPKTGQISCLKCPAGKSVGSFGSTACVKAIGNVPVTGVLQCDGNDGSDYYFDLGSMSIIKAAEKNAFALDLWLWNGNPKVYYNRLIDFRNDGDDRIAVWFDRTDGRMVYYVVRGDGSPQVIVTTAVFPAKAWTRVAIMHNAAKQATIYWNGVAQTATVGGGTLSADKQSGTVHLPKEVTRNTHMFGSNGFTGKIRDVRIWNKAATLAQILGTKVAPAIQVALTVTDCAAGKFAVPGTAAAGCKECGAGTFAAAKTSVCTLCAADARLSYQDQAGQGACKTCNAASKAITNRTGCKCTSANGEKWDPATNTCKLITGTFTWSYSPCKPVVCGDPKAVAGAAMIGSKFKYLDSVAYLKDQP